VIVEGAARNVIHLLCSTRGHPASHLKWSYIRHFEIQREGEEEPEVIEQLGDVGVSRLEVYPVRVDESGEELRRLGLVIPCCQEKLVACSLDPSVETRTVIQIEESNGSWQIEEVTPTPEAPPEDPEEAEEEEEEEAEPWSTEVLLASGISSFLLLLLVIIIVACCCCSIKKRRARQRRNDEIRRREIYSGTSGGSRSRSRSLGRRSTKRKAPNPCFPLDQEPLTISP